MKKLLALIFSIFFILAGLSVTSPAQITVEEVLERGPHLLRGGQYRTVIEMIKALPDEKRNSISILILESFANLKAWGADREVGKKKRWLDLYYEIKSYSESKATPVLLEILKDPDPRIRYYTIDFLKAHGDQRAIAVLEELSKNDPHKDVRSIAVKALEVIRTR